MAVGYNNKIQLGEVHAKSLDVVLEGRCVVPGVEEDVLAVMFDEGGKPPVFRDSFIVGKRVIENRNAIFCDGIPVNDEMKRNQREPEKSTNDFHGKPP